MKYHFEIFDSRIKPATDKQIRGTIKIDKSILKYFEIILN